ncbi:hypothetical protein GNI_094570 [Gregarina niphandrodes]|uniref:Uncharacterized protein n=1 Tax=Gregarina niphandrodes TaxID=110365 RepID=A0A023B587_GRENI|nr:hypothetical protein GNI_094570 [Gregarina niphandrodes]EZG58481.1 hypothetical protein GNI_094570 [Gregarina niphandrodes]|eukprot:XP_011130954.1 hypothetical protein GNI_094570 [Gregarina niphandrodes]
MFETSSTAHYGAPGLGYSSTDSVATVTVNTTKKALRNTTEGESTTMSSSSLLDLVSTVTSATMKRMFEASSTAHYDAPGLTDSVAPVTVEKTKKALHENTVGEDATTSPSSSQRLVSESVIELKAKGLQKSTGPTAATTAEYETTAEHKTTTVYPSQLKMPMTRRELDGLELPWSDCRYAFRSKDYKEEPYPRINAAIGKYPCEGSEVKCRVRAEGEMLEQWIKLIGYNTTVRDVMRRMSPFNTKDKLYATYNCQYECRKMRPDLASVSNLRTVETEPTSPEDALKLRLSRRELSKLQLPLVDCEKYLKGGWQKLQGTGRHPCGGGSGVMMCKEKNEFLSCHRFGPLSMNAFAVEDAVRHYSSNVGDCVVRCGSRSDERRSLWDEAHKHLFNTLPGYDPERAGYSSDKPPRWDFEYVLPTFLPADRSCSSTCGSTLQPCDNVHNCVCRVAHSKCQTEFEGKPQTVESWGFDTRMEDVFKMQSVPGANIKSGHHEAKDLRLDTCQNDCHGVLWSSENV